MNSPVVTTPVVSVVPIVPEVKAKGKGKGRAKKVVDQPVLSSSDVDANVASSEVNASDKLDTKPRKNLIAKYALLHSFQFFLAKKSLDAGIFDQSLFDRFLRQFLFFDDVSSLSDFFDNLDLKTLLKDAKAAVKIEAKKKAGKVNKPSKAKKAKEADANTPTDLISSLVNLANGTEPTVNASSPANVLNTSDAPGAPVKPKRKYNRKPKTASIAEELQKNEDDV